MPRAMFLLTSLLAITCVGCNSPKTADTVTPASDRASDSDEASVQTPAIDGTPARDIESIVVAKDGLFRVVVCRASNLRGLAIRRRDLFAARGTALLLRDLFASGATDWLEQHNAVSVDPKEFATLDIDTFEQLANKMSVEVRSVTKLGDAFFIAHLVGTIKHDDIRLAIDPLIAAIGEQHNVSVENQRVMSQVIMASYTVGWVGNESDSAFDSWTDPDKITVTDPNK